MPPGVVTVMLTVPVPAGEVALTCVAETTVKLEAAAVPKWTALAPVRLVPVTVTTVPPAVEPLAGFNPLTVGAGVTVS